MAQYEDRLGDYVDVSERIRIFRDRYPDGSLQPLNPAEPFGVLEVGGQIFITYTAAAYRHPEDPLPGVAVAWEPFPGKTPYTRDSELMNAETAAWGRAIVAALAADTKKIASLDEVRARRGAPESQETRPEPRRASQFDDTAGRGAPATDAQERALFAMSKKLGVLPPPKASLTKAEAGKKIEELQTQIDGQKAQTEEEPF